MPGGARHIAAAGNDDGPKAERLVRARAPGKAAGGKAGDRQAHRRSCLPRSTRGLAAASARRASAGACTCAPGASIAFAASTGHSGSPSSGPDPNNEDRYRLRCGRVLGERRHAAAARGRQPPWAEGLLHGQRFGAYLPIGQPARARWVSILRPCCKVPLRRSGEMLHNSLKAAESHQRSKRLFPFPEDAPPSPDTRESPPSAGFFTPAFRNS